MDVWEVALNKYRCCGKQWLQGAACAPMLRASMVDLKAVHSGPVQDALPAVTRSIARV
jgi:hypothetical protein